MDEVRRLCVRMLGEPGAEAAAEEALRAAADGDRTSRLRAALMACRAHEPAGPGGGPGETGDGETGGGSGGPGRGDRLADHVAGELRRAVGGLAPGEREALALRDLLGLSYEEISAVTDAEPDAVALRLAAARLALRERLRGPGEPQPECPERERALRTIAARQDEQPVPAADDGWIIDHLGHCRGCAQAHAAMLEASACYRAWDTADREDAARRPGSGAGPATPAGAGA